MKKLLFILLLVFLIPWPFLAMAGPPPGPPIGPHTNLEVNSLVVGSSNPLRVDTDGDGDADYIEGDEIVDLSTDDTYTITAWGAIYNFDIDALDSHCTVTLLEASLWIGKTIGVCLSSANATYDLRLDPGDATDRFVDFDRVTNLTSAAGEYIGADGANECVYLQSVGNDIIAIINADGSLPTGWVEE